MPYSNGTLMDSGTLTLYQVASTEGVSVPAKWSLTELGVPPYQERVVGYSHYYDAQRANQSVDRTVRVWWDSSLANTIHTERTVILIGGRYYRILKITITTDNDGLPVFDFDLRDDDEAIRRKLS